MIAKRGRFQSPFVHLGQARPCCKGLNSTAIPLFPTSGALELQTLYFTPYDQVLVSGSLSRVGG